MQKTTWAILGVLVAAMMLLVACGADDSDDDATDGDLFAQFASEERSAGDSDGGGTGGGFAATAPDAAPPLTGETTQRSSFGFDDSNGGLEPVVLQQVSDGRVIIYTSSMVVEVESVPLATQQSKAAIAGLGGLVFGQDTTTQPFARTVLTFKVLPAVFDEALARLGELGDVESQQVSTDDVTDVVVDLESRIITSEASVERLRTFLENAISLEDVAALEAQLLIRETDLERLRGQLRTIQDQAALATIFLTLVEPAPDALEAQVELVQTAYLGTDEGARCPGDDELEVDEGEAITVCFAIENVGNLGLTELEVRDGGLDLDEDDFTVLEGSLESLAPGERLIGYFDTTAELSRFSSPRLSAVVVDEDGDPVRVPLEVESEPVELDVIEDLSVPSFTDGLFGSLGALFVLGQVAVLAVGVVLPFIWVPALIVGIVIWIRRSASNRRPDPVVAPTAEGSADGDGGS